MGEFILVLLGHGIEKKAEKSHPKKIRIQGWLKWAQFLLIEFWGLPTLHLFISGEFLDKSFTMIAVTVPLSNGRSRIDYIYLMEQVLLAPKTGMSKAI